MLDFKYLDEVVKLARDNDSNALAEIYAATCKKQYAFALGYLGDEFSAQDALQECYSNVFNSISLITDGHMAIAFVAKANLEACFALKKINSSQSVKIGSGEYSIRRIQRLTLSESMCLLLRYACGMSLRQTARLLEIRVESARGYIKSGRENLNEKV